MLGATTQNLVGWATGHVGFVQHYIKMLPVTLFKLHLKEETRFGNKTMTTTTTTTTTTTFTYQLHFIVLL